MTDKIVEKIKLILVLIVSIIILVLGTTIISKVSANNFEVNPEKCFVEYGDKVNTHLSHYLTGREKEKVLKSAKCIFKVPNQIGRDYPKVGVYTALVKYDGELLSFRVEVKDTIKPVFTKFTKEVDVPVGTTLDELKSYFSAYDLSGARIIIQSDELNLDSPGKYYVNVIAKDPYGNMISKTCVVNVEGGAGLANAGQYINSDGEVVYFEEYYNYDAALKARNERAASGEYVVTDVFEDTYNGKKVYRYEWHVKASKKESVDKKDDDKIEQNNNENYVNPDYYPTTPTQPVEPNPDVTPSIPGGGTQPVVPSNPDTGGSSGGGNQPVTPPNPDTGGSGEGGNQPVTPPNPDTGGSSGGGNQPVTPPTPESNGNSN